MIHAVCMRPEDYEAIHDQFDVSLATEMVVAVNSLASGLAKDP